MNKRISFKDLVNDARKGEIARRHLEGLYRVATKTSDIWGLRDMTIEELINGIRTSIKARDKGIK